MSKTAPTTAGSGMTTTVRGSFDEVKARVTEALAAQGFGILTEIDVKKTLKEKLGVEFERYLILGACNPQLAHQALGADRAIGLLLPCNVTLREVEADRIEVSILDPERMFELASDAAKAKLGDLPGEAKARLTRALEALAE